VKQNNPDLSVRRQCSLLSLARSSLYYHPRGESAENLRFMEITGQSRLAHAAVKPLRMLRK
jgi:hypothetical protein